MVEEEQGSDAHSSAQITEMNKCEKHNKVTKRRMFVDVPKMD